MRVKDERYAVLKTVLLSGQIKRLDQCFLILPKTTISKDLKVRPATFNKRINNVALFSIEEVQALADLFEVDYEVLNNILHNQYLEERALKMQNKATRKLELRGRQAKAP
jgi:hypothetical protein